MVVEQDDDQTGQSFEAVHKSSFKQTQKSFWRSSKVWNHPNLTITKYAMKRAKGKMWGAHEELLTMELIKPAILPM